jgi:hypothetical protein
MKSRLLAILDSMAHVKPSANTMRFVRKKAGKVIAGGKLIVSRGWEDFNCYRAKGIDISIIEFLGKQ